MYVLGAQTTAPFCGFSLGCSSCAVASTSGKVLKQKDGGQRIKKGLFRHRFLPSGDHGGSVYISVSVCPIF